LVSDCLARLLGLMLTGAGKYRDLQRVTVPYAKLLGVVETEEPGEAMET
jgi:protein HIRA/HIR1